MIAVALDAGLSRATTREVARRSERKTSSVRSTVLTISAVNVSVFALLAGSGAAFSGWLASSWLQPQGLEPASLRSAIVLMSLAIGLQQPRTVFIAALNGLERQVATNVLTVSAALARGTITIAVLLAEPSIAAFFWTQLVLSGLETGVIGLVVWRVLPAGSREQGPTIDVGILREIAPFALADGGNVFIGSAVMNADKIVLSGLAPLDFFGSYGLLSLLAQSLARLPTPFTVAYFPHFVKLKEVERLDDLSRAYHRAMRELARLLIPATAVAVIFAGSWTTLALGGNATERELMLVLVLLATGFCAHALMHLPYALQLAHNWTSFGIGTNTVALVIYVPLLVILVPKYGPVIAPTLFATTMLVLLPVFIVGTHRRLIPDRVDAWWVDTIIAPLGLACLLLVPARTMTHSMSALGAALVGTFIGLAAAGLTTLLQRMDVLTRRDSRKEAQHQGRGPDTSALTYASDATDSTEPPPPPPAKDR